MRTPPARLGARRGCSTPSSGRCRTTRRASRRGVPARPTGRCTTRPPPAAPWLTAPLHVLLTGAPGRSTGASSSSRRRPSAWSTRRCEVAYRVEDSGVKTASGRARVRFRIDGDEAETTEALADRPLTVPVPLRHAGPTVARARGRTAARRGLGHQQPGGGRRQRRARPAARAADLRSAASGRAHLAQPAEVRSGGRSGALHHPATAGQGRRDAADANCR